MRLTIDVSCPSWLRKLARVAVPAFVITTSGVALAVPVTFSSGDTLTAAALNDNFEDLEDDVTDLVADVANLGGDLADVDSRTTTLEAAPTYLVSTSDALEGAAAVNTPLVYQSVSVTLTPGTWLVQATSTAFTTGSPDAVQVALWNDVSGAEIPNTRGGIHYSGPIGGAGCGGANSSCFTVGASTSAVVAVAVDTTIKIRAIPNGGSRIWMGPPGAVIVLSPANRITAVRLR